MKFLKEKFTNSRTDERTDEHTHDGHNDMTIARWPSASGVKKIFFFTQMFTNVFLITVVKEDESYVKVLESLIFKYI